MIFFLLSFQAILVCANARQPTNLSNGDIGFLEDIGTAFHPQQQNVYKKSSTEYIIQPRFKAGSKVRTYFLTTNNTIYGLQVNVKVSTTSPTRYNSTHTLATLSIANCTMKFDFWYTSSKDPMANVTNGSASFDVYFPQPFRFDASNKILHYNDKPGWHSFDCNPDLFRYNERLGFLVEVNVTDVGAPQFKFELTEIAMIMQVYHPSSPETVDVQDMSIWFCCIMAASFFVTPIALSVSHAVYEYNFLRMRLAKQEAE